MELPSQGRRPTSAGDDGRLPRFPDCPPPPRSRDDDASQENAALVRRRDELLWELHNEQIRLDMILRELVETEYAMAARSAPAAQCPVPTVPWSLDGWHRRGRASSATTWEGAPLRQPSTCTEHPPCCRRSPAAVTPSPVYPHVERSPSPIATSRYLEYCRSPSKQTLTEVALVPGVANAGVRLMGSAFIHQEVTREHKDAVGGELKSDLGDGDGVQPSFESGNQNSGQRNAAETTMVDLINEPGWRSCQYRPAGPDKVAFKPQKQLEFSELAPNQPWPGSDTKQRQECRSSRATVQRMGGYLELSQLPSKQIQADKTLMPVVSNTRSTQSASGEVAPGDQSDINTEPKADVDKIGNQSSGQRKAEESAMEAHINRPVQSPRGYMAAGTAYNEQKGIELCELQPGSDTKRQQECRSPGARESPFSGYVELCQSPSKQTPVEVLVPAAANGSTQPTQSVSFCHEVAPGIPQVVGGESKVDMENGHGVQPLHETKNQSSEQRKVEESAKEGQIDKPLQPLQYKLAGQEKAAYNEHKRIDFSEPTPERTSSGLKRRLTEATPPVKKPKPFKEFSCPICQVKPTSQRNLEEHLAGRLHQSNVEALQARNETAELNTNARPGLSNKNFAWDGESLRRDGKENIGLQHQPSVKDRLELPPSRWTCSLCQAKCCTESDYYEHLRGRRHRENTEAEIGSGNGDDGLTADWDWRRAYYCDLCGVQCNGEKMLTSHLGGRRHREALEAKWRE